jgi:hypothetical protein
VVATLLSAIAPALGDSFSPYARTPATGDSVRFDGSIGGEKQAWSFFDQQWLDAWLRFTIEASASPRSYESFRGVLDGIADHVTALPNGTAGVVVDVKKFQYRTHGDTEVRVRVAGGKLNGAELWTTASELVDSSGKNYFKH